MLRLLLDEQIAPAVASEVRRHEPACDIVSIHEWEDAAFLETDDALILAQAHRQGRTLVTRDVSTIAPLLELWGHIGRSHGGVIFVDDRTIPEGNVGALVRPLVRLWREEHDRPWEDQVVFIERVQ